MMGNSQENEVLAAELRRDRVLSDSRADDIKNYAVEEAALADQITLVRKDLAEAEKNIAGWSQRKLEAEAQYDELSSRLAARMEASTKMRVEALLGRK